MLLSELVAYWKYKGDLYIQQILNILLKFKMKKIG